MYAVHNGAQAFRALPVEDFVRVLARAVPGEIRHADGAFQLVGQRPHHLLTGGIVVPDDRHPVVLRKKVRTGVQPCEVLAPARHGNTVAAVRLIACHRVKLALKQIERAVFRPAKVHPEQNRLGVLLAARLALALVQLARRTVFDKHRLTGLECLRRFVIWEHHFALVIAAHAVGSGGLLRNAALPDVLHRRACPVDCGRLGLDIGMLDRWGIHRVRLFAKVAQQLREMPLLAA